ncbi:hypothetical protein I4U23_022027 [Adineta vaga]|nr:hypothetical protein I4U23_022027 [Adineta vaga]
MRVDTIKSPSKPKYFILTFNQLLSFLCAAAVPLAICAYTTVDSQQKSKEAEANRHFDLQVVEKLHGPLNKSEKPWVFANAHYWSANRQWNPEMKVESLDFLKQKGLIGRQCWNNDNHTQKLDDIIQLNGLNFDYIHMKSQTNGLLSLNMTCGHFDQVSLVESSFHSVNLDGATFDGSPDQVTTAITVSKPTTQQNHDMIGSSKVQLKDVFDDGKYDQWVTIYNGGSSSMAGEIHVIMFPKVS